MIDETELLYALESLKTVAKLPPIVEDGKYTMVVPFVALRDEIRRLSGMSEEVVTDEQAAT